MNKLKYGDLVKIISKTNDKNISHYFKQNLYWDYLINKVALFVYFDFLNEQDQIKVCCILIDNKKISIPHCFLEKLNYE